MFALDVCDRIGIAHALPVPQVGPARNLQATSCAIDGAVMHEAVRVHPGAVNFGALLDVRHMRLNKTQKPRADLPLDELHHFEGPARA
ncbi:MAG TPA: hypothetical protein P5114_13965 [Hyphomicrobiaceae bacterium]|nr:hypothetical protein [Hyphomicrobiaceae bacterium]